ncbi:MAG TPA: GDSL-type esterase/lipase family protein [Pricia sp.]|nr:GDSL-type esterase/lipase family protein [Pricia sp.]
MKFYPLVFILLAVSMPFTGSAQDPSRFKDEVEAIQKKYDTAFDRSDETIVFTGSSSIRMWQDLQERFPQHRIVNTGFGGSQASDLSFYIYDLILRFHPKKVFIYEGDNDLFAKKKSDAIIKDLKQIINAIHRNDSTTQVVLLPAKPSIARWNLRSKYMRLNRKMERLAEDNPAVEYANIWDPMLDGREVKQDIFIDDGLHMNAKGYDIWQNVLRPFVN